MTDPSWRKHPRLRAALLKSLSPHVAAEILRIPIRVDPKHSYAHPCEAHTAVCTPPSLANKDVVLHEYGHIKCRQAGGGKQPYPPGWRWTFQDVAGHPYIGKGTDMLGEGCAEAVKQAIEKREASPNTPAKTENPDSFLEEYTANRIIDHLLLSEDHLLEYSRQPDSQCLACLYWHLQKLIAYSSLECVKFPGMDTPLCQRLSKWAASTQDEMDKMSQKRALDLAREVRKLRYAFVDQADKEGSHSPPLPRKKVQPREEQVIKISGRCSGLPESLGQHCYFSARRDLAPVKAKGLGELQERIKELSQPPAIEEPWVRPLKVELGGSTFAFPPETLRAMTQKADVTTTKEKGFQFCADKEGLLRQGKSCVGGECSIKIEDCSGVGSFKGDFHTHPGRKGSYLQKTHSVGDLSRFGKGYIVCVSGKEVDVINCAARKPDAKPPATPRTHWHAFPYVHPDTPSDKKREIFEAHWWFEPELGMDHDFVEIKKLREGYFDSTTLAPKEGQAEAPAKVRVSGTCRGTVCEVTLAELLGGKQEREIKWRGERGEQSRLFAPIPGPPDPFSRLRSQLDRIDKFRNEGFPAEARHLADEISLALMNAEDDLAKLHSKPFMDKLQAAGDAIGVLNTTLARKHLDDAVAFFRREIPIAKVGPAEAVTKAPTAPPVTPVVAKQPRLFAPVRRTNPIALSPCEKAHHLGQKLEKCVLKIKARPQKQQPRNPYAVCRATISIPVCGRKK